MKLSMSVLGASYLVVASAGSKVPALIFRVSTPNQDILLPNPYFYHYFLTPLFVDKAVGAEMKPES